MSQLNNKMSNDSETNMSRRHLIYWLLLVVVCAIAGFFIIKKINDTYHLANIDLSTSDAATVPTLGVSPASSPVNNGSTFAVNITMDTVTSSVDGVDVLSLHFNPAVLQVVDDNTSIAGVQITPGTLLPVTVSNNSYNVATPFDNNGTTITIPAGTIRFSQATQGGGTAFKGSGTLAIVHFKAIANGTSGLTFDFTPGSGTDSNMAFQGNDILAAVTSGTVTVTTPDTTAPTVSITAPANGATVSGSSVTVSATASDNTGVSGVQFKLDGNNLNGEDTSSPYSTTWNASGVTNGSHTLTAVARDAAGNSTTSSTINVTVNNPDITAPAVSITSPNGGSGVSGGSIAVTASASDNIGVVGVQFKVDGANLGSEDTVSPYSVSWNTTTYNNGSHSLTAVARDAAGNTTTSAAVSVSVNNADVTVPTVSITAPANGATVSGSSVTVSATATDNIGVAGVQFKLDGNNLGAEDTSSPYGITWDTTTATNASHSLTAVARDAAGNTKTSTAVSVTVNNVPANKVPLGSIDDISTAGLVRGWSYDPDATTANDQVKIYIDGPVGTGTLATTVTANIDRADVRTANGITGNHGFEWTLPSNYRDGNYHSVYAYGVDTSSTSITAVLGNANRKFTGKTVVINPQALANKTVAGKVSVLNASKVLMTEMNFTSDSNGQIPIVLDMDPQTVYFKITAVPFLIKILGNVNLSTAGSITIPMLLTGDINSDNIINSVDFSIVNGNWFTSNAVSDLNKDGLVNSIDFSYMNQNWLMTGDQ